MARSNKRRERHRTAIVGGDGDPRAEIIVPVESLERPDGAQLRLEDLRRWFGHVDRFRSGDLAVADSAASIVLDDFAFVLYVGTAADGCEVTGTHDGPEFVTRARNGTVDVYLTADVDVRRAKPSDLDRAAAERRLAGARVSAFVVQSL